MESSEGKRHHLENYYVHISCLTGLLVRRGLGTVEVRGHPKLVMHNDGNQCYLLSALQLLRSLLDAWPEFGHLLSACGIFGECLLLLLTGRLTREACSDFIRFCPQLALGHGSERGSAQLQCACAFGGFPCGRSGYWQ